MELITALEITHELADHGRLDEKLAEVISSDLSEQAAEQRDCVDMFESFIAKHHQDLSNRFADRIDRLEALDLDDIPEISLETIRSVDRGPMGYMMSTVLELACQAMSDVGTAPDPAVWARVSGAVNIVGQFWVESGADIARQMTAQRPDKDSTEPGM